MLARYLGQLQGWGSAFFSYAWRARDDVESLMGVASRSRSPLLRVYLGPPTHDFYDSLTLVQR